MKIEKITRYRVLLLLFLFFTFDSYFLIGQAVQKTQKDYEVKLQENIKYCSIQTELLKEKEQQYKDTLEKIISTLYIKDSYLSIGGSSGKLPYDTVDMYEEILTRDSSFDSLLQDVNNFYNSRQEFISTIPNIFPLTFSKFIRISSSYGNRYDPFSGRIEFHNGIDLVGTWKSEIVATADGVVENHWIYHPTYGRMIHIVHDNGFETIYGHLSKSYVYEGKTVKKGDVIGLLGNSGKSTGPHLHYAVKLNGQFVDPINFLKE